MLTLEQQTRLIAIWVAQANELPNPLGGHVPLFYAGHACGPSGLLMRYFIVAPGMRQPYQEFFIDWASIRDDAGSYGFVDIVEALS